MKLIFTLGLILAVSPAIAQEDGEGDWRLYKPSDDAEDSTKIEVNEPLVALNDSAQYFSPADLNFDSSKVGVVKVSKDGRIDEIIEFLGTPVPPDPVQIDGYRVQLFFDQERDKVLGERARFLSAYTEEKAYIVWDAPNHYLRVGNYYTKQQALKVAEDLKIEFPSATVYKTRIDLPDLD